MSVTDELVPLLKKLRMGGVLQSLELRMREATDDNLGHTEFLYRIIKDEVERRDAKQLEQRGFCCVAEVTNAVNPSGPLPYAAN